LALDPAASSGKVFTVPTYVYDDRQIPSKEELGNWGVKLGLEV